MTMSMKAGSRPVSGTARAGLPPQGLGREGLAPRAKPRWWPLDNSRDNGSDTGTSRNAIAASWVRSTLTASPSGAEPALANTRVVPLLAERWSHVTGGRQAVTDTRPAAWSSAYRRGTAALSQKGLRTLSASALQIAHAPYARSATARKPVTERRQAVSRGTGWDGHPVLRPGATRSLPGRKPSFDQTPGHPLHWLHDLDARGA